MIETKKYGREVMVQFTCQRCRKTACLPYTEVMTGDHYGYLHNSKMPEGWSELYYQPMCEDCTSAFKAFMTVQDGDDHGES